MAKYAFLPWARQGLIGALAPGAPLVGGRVQLPVTAKVIAGSEATTVTPGSVRLFGPGDVTSLTAQVIRTDPVRSSTGNEPNYLALVEFARPDLPWMFTPEATAGAQLRPWICLVVVERRDGVELLSKDPARPQVLSIKKGAAADLPDLSEAWAWVHAQVAMTSDADGDLAALRKAIVGSPERTLSRLICPRKLVKGKKYIACVVPTYLGGLQAGLGREVKPETATDEAWSSSASPDSIDLPAYFSWEFSTGDEGDFASLLARLRRKKLTNAEVGTRKLNISAGGYGLPASKDVDLEGALGPPLHGAPIAVGPSKDFETRLRSLLNGTAEETLPVLPPPLYGRWHAAQRSIPDPPPAPAPPRNRLWLGDLNLDPRYRVPAGLGAQIVREHQEQLMASAWNQVGAVEQANQLIRCAQLARSASTVVYKTRFATLDATTLLMITGPSQSRIAYGDGTPKTARSVITESALPVASTSAAWRRLLRPRGGPARAFGIASSAARRDLIAGLNDNTLRPSPATWPVPDGMVSTKSVSGFSACGTSLPQLQQNILNQWTATKFDGNAKALIVVAAAMLALTGRVGATPATVNLLKQAVADFNQAIKCFADYQAQPPRSPNPFSDFYAVGCLAMLHGIWCLLIALLLLAKINVSNPIVAILFNQALKKLKEEFDRNRADIQAAAVGIAITQGGQPFESCNPPREPDKPRLDIAGFNGVVLQQLNPAVTIPKRLSSSVVAPGWNAEEMQTILVAPDFPTPIYQELAALSQEWLLPGLANVPPDSLSMVESNARFIEALMVGANHEMSRELLWRGYPTDQRGTYFRQFWDPSGRFPSPLSDADLETSRDIPPIHEWLDDALGSHLGQPSVAAAAAGAIRPPTSPVVLLLRGQLLQRYPRANIFLAKAQWNQAAGKRDPFTGDEGTASQILHPLFRGSLAPDISFLGFSIDGADAIGDVNDPNNLGWFLAIEQPPTEPRHGLAAAPPAGAPSGWQDLAWPNVSTAPGSDYIRLRSGTVNFPLATSNNPAGWKWAADSDSAQLASISVRKPVRVYIHASELL